MRQFAPSEDAAVAKSFDDQIDLIEQERKRRKAADPDEVAARKLMQKDPALKYEDAIAEAVRKREKREKSARIISAVSDGLSALGNLFFTTQYAPSMYNPGNSLTAAETAKQDKLKAEREKNRDAYLNYSLKIGELEAGKARTLRELEAAREKMKMAREKNQREAEEQDWKRTMQPELQRKTKGEADRAIAQATSAQAEAEIAKDLGQAKLDTERARAANQRAGAAAGYASAKASNARAAAAQKKHHFLGKEYLSEKDWETAVLKAARTLYPYKPEVKKGDKVITPQSGVRISWEDRTLNGTNVHYRKTEDIAAEVETLEASKKKGQGSGSLGWGRPTESNNQEETDW